MGVRLTTLVSVKQQITSRGGSLGKHELGWGAVPEDGQPSEKGNEDKTRKGKNTNEQQLERPHLCYLNSRGTHALLTGYSHITKNQFVRLTLQEIFLASSKIYRAPRRVSRR